MRALYERYPALLAVLPCVELAQLPTPVQSLQRSDRAWIKRDDLTHPVYGGNKIRKLEFVLGDIRKRRSRRVICFGAVGTNAGVATALVCRDHGLQCELLLFDQPPSTTVRDNLCAMQALGAKLTYCGSLGQTLLRFYLHPRRLDPRSYFLFAGCSNPVATFAYVSAAFELKQQIMSGACPEPEQIVVAVGSSATLAGLTLGCALAGLRTQVIGVRVAPRKVGPFDACTQATVQAQMRWAMRWLRQHLPNEPLAECPEPELREDYYGAGYGVATPAALAAMRHFTEQEDITLEQTYSGKAAAAFLDRLQRGTGPVLFWNTYNSRPMTGLGDRSRLELLPENLKHYLKA